ncbi:MAG: VOC family protein [Rhizobiaceae bacterium]
MRRLQTVTFLVRDYDEAVAWFRNCLSFELIEDTALGGGKRWVVVAASAGSCQLLLASADGDDQLAAVGNQTGGRVAFFLETGDFARDHAAMVSKGVEFLEAPRHEEYGTVAVFRDLYGNKWDLIERAG